MCLGWKVAAVFTVPASDEDLFTAQAVLSLTLLVPKKGWRLEVKIVVCVPGKL